MGSAAHSRRRVKVVGLQPQQRQQHHRRGSFPSCCCIFGWASHPPMLQHQLHRAWTHSAQLQQQHGKDPSATSNTARLEHVLSSARHKFRHGSSPVSYHEDKYIAAALGQASSRHHHHHHHRHHHRGIIIIVIIIAIIIIAVIIIALIIIAIIIVVTPSPPSQGAAQHHHHHRCVIAIAVRATSSSNRCSARQH
uniref:Uncharacterized protein n=1 Tax=Anopheles melas TaxID=34690 RepID=A0A182U7B8_9DIPT